MKIFETESARLLIDALCALETKEEYEAFLEDLLTVKEIDEISQRMMVAKLLTEKNVYNRISEKTGASSATIGRVNRSFTYGVGGYRLVFEKLSEAKNDN